jgi:hypothetical protein
MRVRHILIFPSLTCDQLPLGGTSSFSLYAPKSLAHLPYSAVRSHAYILSFLFLILLLLTMERPTNISSTVHCHQRAPSDETDQHNTTIKSPFVFSFTSHSTSITKLTIHKVLFGQGYLGWWVLLLFQIPNSKLCH